MRKTNPMPDSFRNNSDMTVSAPIMKDDLPTGGGLGGIKRLQLQQRGQGSSKTMISSAPAKVAPAGYEQPKPMNFNQRLSTLSSPNFPRRRGQG